MISPIPQFRSYCAPGRGASTRDSLSEWSAHSHLPLYIHTCYCLNSVKQIEQYNSVKVVSSVQPGATSISDIPDGIFYESALTDQRYYCDRWLSEMINRCQGWWWCDTAARLTCGFHAELMLILCCMLCNTHTAQHYTNTTDAETVL